MTDKIFPKKHSDSIEQKTKRLSALDTIPDIQPTSDFMFKNIFGTHEDLLVSFLNSILDEEDQVNNVTIQNTTALKTWVHGKTSILDVKAQGLNGKFYHIEMQVENEADYENRSTYYWSRLYGEQLRASEDYSELTKAISIHILDFVPDFFKEDDLYHDTHDAISRYTRKRYMKHFEVHFILLNKFPHQEPNIYSKIKRKLDEWILFFKKAKDIEEDNIPKELNHPDIKKAIHIFKTLRMSKEAKMFHDSDLEAKRRERSRWHSKIEIAREEAAAKERENTLKAEQAAEKAEKAAKEAKKAKEEAEKAAKKAKEEAEKAAKEAIKKAKEAAARDIHKQDTLLEMLLISKDPISGKALFEKHLRGRYLSTENCKAISGKIMHCSPEKLAETVLDFMQQQT